MNPVFRQNQACASPYRFWISWGSHTLYFLKCCLFITEEREVVVIFLAKMQNNSIFGQDTNDLVRLLNSNMYGEYTVLKLYWKRLKLNFVHLKKITLFSWHFLIFRMLILSQFTMSIKSKCLISGGKENLLGIIGKKVFFFSIELPLPSLPHPHGSIFAFSSACWHTEIEHMRRKMPARFQPLKQILKAEAPFSCLSKNAAFHLVLFKSKCRQPASSQIPVWLLKLHHLVIGNWSKTLKDGW